MVIKKQQKEVCSVPDCERETFCLGLCNPCYHRMYYWNKRSMKDKVKRLKQIQIWENSLDLQMGNIHQIAKHRKKA